MNRSDAVGDVQRGTDYAAERAKTGIDEAKSQIKDSVERYGDKAQQTYQEMRHAVRQNMGDIETQIREKPVQATLVAAGIGFLIGALLTR